MKFLIGIESNKPRVCTPGRDLAIADFMSIGLVAHPSITGPLGWMEGTAFNLLLQMLVQETNALAGQLPIYAVPAVSVNTQYDVQGCTCV